MGNEASGGKKMDQTSGTASKNDVPVKKSNDAGSMKSTGGAAISAVKSKAGSVGSHLKKTSACQRVLYIFGGTFAILMISLIWECYDQTRPPVGITRDKLKKARLSNEANEDGDMDTYNDFTFESHALAFSPMNAYQLARCSELVYNPWNNVTSVLKRWGFKDRQFLTLNDTEAFVAANDDVVVVAFRGTSSLNDALTDLNFFQKETERGGVHDGFYDAIALVWDNVLAAVEKYSGGVNGTKPIWVTGHSLGGALATIATARLRLDHDLPVHGLYTYGSPRVFSKKYARIFNQDFAAQTFRFVHNLDIVPRVPFRTLGGYRHIGRFMYLDSEGQLRRRVRFTTLLEDLMSERFYDLLNLLSFGDPDFSAASDHYLDGYIGSLQNGIDSKFVTRCRIGQCGQKYKLMDNILGAK
mmetsp:Transcript_1220/g.1623  ORF Transcript_1220/g.1623 Transcript_1220/m.1623 type:complete len:413 (-) Transcript_1220:299-1537(-)